MVGIHLRMRVNTAENPPQVESNPEMEWEGEAAAASAAEAEAAAADFNCLNESCISHILSFTSPLDVSRSSAVSTLFRSASQSDAVWEKFLPLDYPQILSTSPTSSSLHFSSKKDIFFRLCNYPILLNGSRKIFCLEKSSGRKCYALPARELLIVWRDIPRRWRWISRGESRIGEVAELLGVNWLEISGKFDIHLLSSEATYAAFLVLKFTEDALGLDQYPVELMVKVEGNVCKNDAFLLPTESERQMYQKKVGILAEQQKILRRAGTSKFRHKSHDVIHRRRIPVARTDGWLEIEMREFFVGKSGRGEVEMSMMEIKSGHFKCGLIIQGIEIRPKK